VIQAFLCLKLNEGKRIVLYFLNVYRAIHPRRARSLIKGGACGECATALQRAGERGQ